MAGDWLHQRAGFRQILQEGVAVDSIKHADAHHTRMRLRAIFVGDGGREFTHHACCGYFLLHQEPQFVQIIQRRQTTALREPRQEHTAARVLG